MLLLLVPVGLATVIGLFVLWPSGEPTRAEQAAETYMPPGTTYPHARVVSVETGDCTTDPSVPAECTTAVVEILDGEGTGDFERIELPPDAASAGVKKGDALVLTRDAGAEAGSAYAFFDYERDTPMIVLAVAFVVVVAAVARLRGLASLLGLGFAFVVLLQFVLPGLLADDSPTLVSPVSWAAETASEPMTATRVRPKRVPTSAVVVRAENPCAR